MATYDVGGYKVYLEKGIEAEKDVVTIDLVKFLFMEKMTVDGLKRF
ncbi:MAG TPA: hypothetical protein VFC96_06840 [Anaerovoracaceae bacterium]|nr:hypothetical protein [Anaerovoracaceae bacterium]